MDKKLYPRIGEEVIWETLDNGLPVCIVPKQGFSRKYALFATRYGGMDMRFELNGQWLDTPAGIAHYLEHKMFDTKDGNALQELAKNGAEPNAFTSNAITCYYFDSTEKFYENLEILLSFVSVPYFTDESVEKEQGIIGQEIGMIEDNPEWQVYKQMMQALYRSSPARTPVAGSVESISHITAQTLYDCHKAFYTPANMCLVVVGDVDPSCAPMRDFTAFLAQRPKAAEPPALFIRSTMIPRTTRKIRMWNAESDNYGNFIMSFSDASAGPGLCLGSIVAIVFTFIYYWLRGLIGFEKSFESVPNGFIQMVSPILILCFAWTLCGLCRDNGLQVGTFVEVVMANTGNLAKFLPAVIFIVACFIGFATGTSWGTIGIMVPLVCAVFDWTTQVDLLSIGLAASCAGGVCGDHLSPISDTTIMASAGAHCYHLNHVSTQIPYGVTVAAVSFVSFIIAGLVQNVVICMIIAIALMIVTLFVIKAVVAKKHAGIFQEMAEADKALAK